MSSSPSRYTAHMDLRDVNDAHILAVGRVPAGSRVLDLGVADGSVAGVLKAMGCRVWGVELDAVAAEEAACSIP
jgi:predicted RNA methylase